MKLEKFNLEKALNGTKVVTRDGREVTQLTKFEGIAAGYSLVGVLKKGLNAWTIEGRYSQDSTSNMDLFLEGKVRRAWVNIYGNGRDIITSGGYRTKQDAMNSIITDYYEYIKTIEITDEL